MAFYEPTMEERDAIGKKSLIAAFRELKVLDDNTLPRSAHIHAVIKAFKKVSISIKDESEAILLGRGEKRSMSYYPSHEAIVFGALFANLIGLSEQEVLDDVDPNSVAGEKISIAVSASMLINAVSDAMSCADDDDGDGNVHGYMSDEADRFICEFIK